VAHAKTRTNWLRGANLPEVRDFVSFSMPAGSTHAQTIQRLAKETGHRIEGLLPQTLNHMTYLREKKIFGSATPAVMQILDNHSNLSWSESNGGWRFEVRHATIDLSRFDEAAGRLMCDVKRGANGRIPRDEYLRLTAQLEAFKPTDWLEGRKRKALALWNQTHPRNALNTFSEACKDPRFHRAVLRRFNRAEAQYRKAHPEL
jgi:hypothetical protein